MIIPMHILLKTFNGNFVIFFRSLMWDDDHLWIIEAKGGRGTLCGPIPWMRKTETQRTDIIYLFLQSWSVTGRLGQGSAPFRLWFSLRCR